MPITYVPRTESLIDLNTLIDPNSGWVLNFATSINAAGQIVGRGTDPNGQPRGYLLTPIPTNKVSGQIYVANYASNNIGSYTVKGKILTPTLVTTGISEPSAVAISGNFLYVTNYSLGTVGKFNATTGETISTTFIAGLGHPTGIAAAGNFLYVVSFDLGLVRKYDATSGAIDGAFLISGLNSPFAVAAFGKSVFGSVGGDIGRYSADLQEPPLTRN